METGNQLGCNQTKFCLVAQAYHKTIVNFRSNSLILEENLIRVRNLDPPQENHKNSLIQPQKTPKNTQIFSKNPLKNTKNH